MSSNALTYIAIGNVFYFCDIVENLLSYCALDLDFPAVNVKLPVNLYREIRLVIVPAAERWELAFVRASVLAGISSLFSSLTSTNPSATLIIEGAEGCLSAIGIILFVAGAELEAPFSMASSSHSKRYAPFFLCSAFQKQAVRDGSAGRSIYGILRHFVPQDDSIFLVPLWFLLSGELSPEATEGEFSHQKLPVILSVSEGSRPVALGVLFTGSFTAARFRMTANLWFSAQKPPVILSVSEGSRPVTLGVLFTGSFFAALIRMTEGRSG